MQIPKYIDEALKRRAKLAVHLMDTCAAVDDWLDKNGITEGVWDDCHDGVEIYTNPYASERRLRAAIEKK